MVVVVPLHNNTYYVLSSGSFMHHLTQICVLSFVCYLNQPSLHFSFRQSTVKQRVCHTVALPFTVKKYHKAKEELWKLKYFTMQKYNVQKIV
jgi:hypothetical protein